MGYVYVLLCRKDDYSVLYVGSTLRPCLARVDEHKQGFGSKYTAKFPEIELVALLEVPKTNARSVEMHLKKNRRLVQDVVTYCQTGVRQPAVDHLERWLREHKIAFKWCPVPAASGRW